MYTDDTSLAGFAYYYAVTAYDTGHSTWTSSDGTRTLSDLPPAAQQSVQSGLESGLSAPEQFFRYSWIPTSPAVAAYAEAETPGSEGVCGAQSLFGRWFSRL